jgi:hypothetical protein
MVVFENTIYKKHLRTNKRYSDLSSRLPKYWYLYPWHRAHKLVFFFLRFVKVTLKTTYNHLRKINKIERETKMSTNVDISHLGTRMAIFKISDIFQIGVKTLGSIVKAICKPFEKVTRNCFIKLEVLTQLPISVISAPRWLISKIWQLFKIALKAQGSIARPIRKPLKKSKWDCDNNVKVSECWC